LHYPEYNLLVDSNLECIDILALGEQPVTTTYQQRVGSFVACALQPRSKAELLDALVVLNKNTTVAYPVGYHLDVVANKELALENGICFVNPTRLGQATSGGPALGRGGAGGGKFCWALWTGPQIEIEGLPISRISNQSTILPNSIAACTTILCCVKYVLPKCL
jgi:hypothetical protein